MQPMRIIACGALAREIQAVIRANGWQHVVVDCLPPALHNRPDRIPEAVGEKLSQVDRTRERVFVAYADCGTGGLLDRVLAEHGVERLPGAHCYQFYAGMQEFEDMAAEEPGTFYLTDFLARHFERLVMEELGIRKHPELAGLYFGHYRRLFYLAQREDEELLERARRAADQLGLPFQYRVTGYRGLAQPIAGFARGARSWPA